VVALSGTCEKKNLSMNRVILITASIAIFGLAIGTEVLAQVRTSTSYHIQSDSINTGGGLGTSTNYRQESTVGEVATGVATSTNYNLYAGYQQMQEVYIAVSAASDVTMAPAIVGLVGGEAEGNTYMIATTDSPSGYQMTYKSSLSPAMQNTISTTTIADYSPATTTPDILFSTGINDEHFAFSPYGNDIVDRYKTNGSSCGSGSASTTACWDGLSTTSTTIAQATSPNHPYGATTTIYYKVGVGNNVHHAPGVFTGTYVATTTITVLPL